MELSVGGRFGSGSAAAARYCSFIPRLAAARRGKIKRKIKSGTSWLFHFEAGQNIYAARRRLHLQDAPRMLEKHSRKDWFCEAKIVIFECSLAHS